MTKPSTKSSTKESAQASAFTDMPDEVAIAMSLKQVRSFYQDPRYEHACSMLKILAHNPPQVILFEGGTVQGRQDIAHYWMLLVNCPQAIEGEPCLTCSTCIRMVTHMHRDCFYLDGAVESIKIDPVREQVCPVLGEAPHEARRRMVVFREAQAMTEATANLMLKSLEEPVSATCFLLLAPQRERLLPTLVSRSMILTLPWPTSMTEPEEDLVEWEVAICRFLATGKGVLQKTGARGAITAPLAQQLLLLCSRSLTLALAGEAKPEQGSLVAFFSKMPKVRQRMASEVLATAEDKLILGVNSTLVVEWMIVRLYILFPR